MSSGTIVLESWNFRKSNLKNKISNSNKFLLFPPRKARMKTNLTNMSNFQWRTNLKMMKSLCFQGSRQSSWKTIWMMFLSTQFKVVLLMMFLLGSHMGFQPLLWPMDHNSIIHFQCQITTCQGWALTIAQQMGPEIKRTMIVKKNEI